MSVAATEPDLVPLRWSTACYLALVESGVIEDGRGVELVDGQIVVAMPQGELHFFVFYALQRVLAATGAYEKGLVSQPTVVLRDGDTYDPELALLRPEAIGRRGLPMAADLLWTVEVSVSSLRTDLSVKKAAYAAAGVPNYWVVDVVGRGYGRSPIRQSAPTGVRPSFRRKARCLFQSSTLRLSFRPSSLLRSDLPDRVRESGTDDLD